MGTLNTELKARSVTIGQKRLDGDVVLPRKAMGLVIFAHGSGSSRSVPAGTRMWRTSWRCGASARCSLTC